MAETIFSKIIRGEIPSHKIYEDDLVYAFLDINPLSPGHTLVIPKKAQARNLLEIDADSLSKMILTVQKLTRVLVDELQPDGVQVAQFNGAPAGQTVFHIHMHIIPRYAGEGLGIHAASKAEAAELEALQARIVARLNG